VNSTLTSSESAPGRRDALDTLGRLYRLAVVLLAGLIVLGVALFLARATVYKIRPYERGLHLRGGRFIAVDEPGWHAQIPLVDTVIIVKVNERLGYVERIAAMTSDDVTMDVSLQYTYRVVHPERFALEVDDPERIVFEFVQGKLRDVVNTKAMTEVMHSRAELNREVMLALQEKEDQYGVEFITVQIQSASPPEEVVTAIKDRMVAVQRQEQAQAEAAQRRTLADADYYAAQKAAEGEAYQITMLAEAEAERIALTSAAQQEAVRAILAQLAEGGELAEAYIQVLIAQELQENSKWIISGGGDAAPVIELREAP
jgi:membrane protease subunit HflK